MKIKKLIRYSLAKPSAVGNADRIWVSTPQNRTIRVNLGIFTAFFGSVSIDAAPLGLGSLVAARFYTDAVPPGLKRAFRIYTVCA